MADRAAARGAWLADAATAAFLAGIDALARVSGQALLFFPELGALTNDVLRRPDGAWARAPLRLILSPFLAGLLGTLITRQLPYGVPAILLSVLGAILILRLLRSPIAPALSAGLLPLTLGETSWWYAPGLLVGTGLLAGIAWLRRHDAPPAAPLPGATAAPDRSWIPAFALFLLGMALMASLSGERFLLFPPLAVLAYEMFAHAAVCPWARRPLALPVICGLAAGLGVGVVALLGAQPLAAGAIALGVTLLLRLFRAHVPPAIAVGLLPLLMTDPDHRYVGAVLFSTAMLTLAFVLWRLARPAAMPGGG